MMVRGGGFQAPATDAKYKLLVYLRDKISATPKCILLPPLTAHLPFNPSMPVSMHCTDLLTLHMLLASVHPYAVNAFTITKILKSFVLVSIWHLNHSITGGLKCSGNYTNQLL